MVDFNLSYSDLHKIANDHNNNVYTMHTAAQRSMDRIIMEMSTLLFHHPVSTQDPAEQFTSGRQRGGNDDDECSNSFTAEGHLRAFSACSMLVIA